MRNLFSFANLLDYWRFIKNDNLQTETWDGLLNTIPEFRHNILKYYNLSETTTSTDAIIDVIKSDVAECSNINELVGVTFGIIYGNIPETPKANAIKNLLFHAGQGTTTSQETADSFKANLFMKRVYALDEILDISRKSSSTPSDSILGFYYALASYLSLIAYYIFSTRNASNGISDALRYLGFDKEQTDKAARKIAQNKYLHKGADSEGVSAELTSLSDWLSPFFPQQSGTSNIMSPFDIFPYVLDIYPKLKARTKAHSKIYENISKAIPTLAGLKPLDRRLVEYIIERISNINLINCETNIIEEIRIVEQCKEWLPAISNVIDNHLKWLAVLNEKAKLIEQKLTRVENSKSAENAIYKNAQKLLSAYQNCCKCREDLLQHLESNKNITKAFDKAKKQLEDLNNKKPAATAPIKNLCSKLDIDFPADEPEINPAIEIHLKAFTVELPFELLSLYPLPSYRLAILQLLDKTSLTEYLNESFMDTTIKITDVLQQILKRESNNYITCADLQSIIDEHRIQPAHQHHTVKAGDIVEFLQYQIFIYFPIINEIFLSLLAMLPKEKISADFFEPYTSATHYLFKDKPTPATSSKNAKRLQYGNFTPIEQHEGEIPESIIHAHIFAFWNESSYYSIKDNENFTSYLEEVVKPYFDHTSHLSAINEKKYVPNYIRFSY